MKTTEDY